MSSEGAPATTGPRRLHRAGIVVLAAGALREGALPLLAVLVAAVAGGGLDAEAAGRTLAIATLGTLVAAIAGAVTWATTTWELDSERLRHRTGLLSVKVTDVPLARVQSVDTVRGPLQRMLGVRGVQVQTAGGGKQGEIVLAAVSAADVEELRVAVGTRREPTQPAAATPTVERRLGRRRLLVAALTSGQIGVVLPILAAAPQLAGELFGDDVRTAGRGGARLLPDAAPEWLLAAAVLLAAAWALSVLGAVVAFAGFAVDREGDRLRIRRGLLARRDATVPAARVQAVLVVEGLLRRPFGLAALRVEVAGYAAEAAAAQTLFPLLRRSEVPAFLSALLPELADDLDELAPPPLRSRGRYIGPPALAGVALGAAAWSAVPDLGAWPLLAVAPGAAWGVLRLRAAGWRLRDGRLVVRSRRLARITVLAPASRLQEHALRQSVLQRRSHLADVQLRLGAATRTRVRHLDEDVAGALYDALAA